jgi:hypothetical protein
MHVACNVRSGGDCVLLGSTEVTHWTSPHELRPASTAAWSLMWQCHHHACAGMVSALEGKASTCRVFYWHLAGVW